MADCIECENEMLIDADGCGRCEPCAANVKRIRERVKNGTMPEVSRNVAPWMPAPTGEGICCVCDKPVRAPMRVWSAFRGRGMTAARDLYLHETPCYPTWERNAHG